MLELAADVVQAGGVFKSLGWAIVAILVVVVLFLVVVSAAVRKIVTAPFRLFKRKKKDEGGPGQGAA